MKVAFYKAKGHIGNRIISWWTNGVYSHCENIVGIDTKSGEYLCASSSGRDHGVRFKIMSLPTDKWDIIDVPSWDDHASYMWFDARLGAGYDYVGLFATWSAVNEDKKRWFCSEACAESVGVNEAWRLSPNDFARVCEVAGGTWVQKLPSK